MRRKITLSKAFEEAGYVTQSGYCIKIKGYAIYAYNPYQNKLAYIAKRLLDGSYQIYNVNGILIFTLQFKESSELILSHIKNICPQEKKRRVFMDNFDFANLCQEAQLAIKDLSKMFNVPRKEAAKWVNEDKSYQEYEVPETVIFQVTNHLDEVKKITNSILDEVRLQNKSKKIILLNFRTEKELQSTNPKLISVSHYSQILINALVTLNKEGYNCQIKQISNLNIRHKESNYVVLPYSD